MSGRFINWKYATEGFFMVAATIGGRAWNAFTWVFVSWPSNGRVVFLYKKESGFLRV